MINLEKRKRIMQRSIMLGHCICNPKQACPCNLFKEKNVCLCAGERLEDAMENVRLTSLVENAGCASKINQNDLKKALAGLPTIFDPRVLVSSDTFDDAAVYSLDGDLALVQTVDVFTPNVDDPYTFGQIAAANSLSDVYAMGGIPLTALSIIGFPIERLSHKVMNQIIRGGVDKMHEARVPVVGGHSINDSDIKFGFAVTGTINPSKIVTNNKAQPNDVLVLTKPIGVGVISFANQMNRASPQAMAVISRSMTDLNKVPSEIMVDIGVSAATDVTGFGLLGHLSEMVCQSRVTVELYVEQLPIFEDALNLVRQGVVSGAIERNKDYASQYVTLADEVTEDIEYMLYDPQTSGGLLISVPEDKSQSLLARLKQEGVANASVIGKVLSRSEGRILVKKNQEDASQKVVSSKQEVKSTPEPSGAPCCEQPPHAECCAPTPDLAPDNAATEIKEKFSAFMAAVNREGAITLRNKELIAIALSVLSKCEPCVKIHMDKARSLGITDSEINEAVWMGISFGGAPTLMFYNPLMGKK